MGKGINYAVVSIIITKTKQCMKMVGHNYIGKQSHIAFAQLKRMLPFFFNNLPRIGQYNLIVNNRPEIRTMVFTTNRYEIRANGITMNAQPDRTTIRKFLHESRGVLQNAREMGGYIEWAILLTQRAFCRMPPTRSRRAACCSRGCNGAFAGRKARYSRDARR